MISENKIKTGNYFFVTNKAHNSFSDLLWIRIPFVAYLVHCSSLFQFVMQRDRLDNFDIIYFFLIATFLNFIISWIIYHPSSCSFPLFFLMEHFLISTISFSLTFCPAAITYDFIYFSIVVEDQVMVSGARLYLLLKTTSLQKLGSGLINQFQMAMTLEAISKMIMASFVLVFSFYIEFLFP